MKKSYIIVLAIVVVVIGVVGLATNTTLFQGSLFTIKAPISTAQAIAPITLISVNNDQPINRALYSSEYRQSIPVKFKLKKDIVNFTGRNNFKLYSVNLETSNIFALPNILYGDPSVTSPINTQSLCNLDRLDTNYNYFTCYNSNRNSTDYIGSGTTYNYQLKLNIYNAQSEPTRYQSNILTIPIITQPAR